MTRADRIHDFLIAAGWGTARRAPLAGDASARRYERLHRADGETAILMDADPATGENVAAFVRIAAHLEHHGFSAPATLSGRAEEGLILLEDFGDDLLSKVMRADPDQEKPLYFLAADVLARLHACPLPDGMRPMTASGLSAMIEPAFTYYAPDIADTFPAASEAFEAALEPFGATPPILCLRDFHAENMIHLPARTGIRQIGLLDFQDAFACHPAYDLVSMLQDARRDVAAIVEAEILSHFIDHTNASPDAFRTAYAVLGAQRNLRILGIFSRLAAVRNKPQYRALQPRVWRHLQRNLSHPALAAVRATLSDLPPPECAK